MATAVFTMTETIGVHPMMLSSILTVVIAVAVFWYSKKERKIKPWSMVPGWIPVLGHIHLIGGANAMKNLPLTIEKWADEYAVQPDQPGCIEVDFSGRRVLFICREDRYNELLKHRVPGKIEHQTTIVEAASSVGADGVFTAGGDAWKQEKKLMSPYLNHGNVQAALCTFQKMTKRLLAKWDTTRESVVAPEKDLALLSADTITIVAMDHDFDFLRNTDSQLFADLKDVTSAIFLRVLSPMRYWRIPVIGQYLDSYGFAIYRIQKIINNVIQEQRCAQTNNRVEDTNKNKTTFLEKIVGLAQSDKKHQIERRRLTGNVTTLFIGAVDTVSKNLTHALHILARDQDLQRELRKEVDRQTENGKKALDFTTLDDLFSKTPRIKSFMHETHRHHNPWINTTTTAEIPFLGTILPAGTNITFMTHYISCNKVCPSKQVPTGPNGEPPHVFCPTRYLVHQEDGSLTCPDPDRNGGAFIPFGFGNRMCPGRTYAEALSLTILASLLQNYEWELPPNHPLDGKLVFEIAYMPRCEVKIKLTPRHATKILVNNE